MRDRGFGPFTVGIGFDVHDWLFGVQVVTGCGECWVTLGCGPLNVWLRCGKWET